MRYGRALVVFLPGLLAVALGCNSMQTSSAILRYQQGEYNAADSLAREALKINPNDGEAYFYMALSESRLRNFRDAYTNFRKAAELKPDRAEMARQNIESNFASAFNEGVEAFKMENTELAIDAFKTATEANPENPLGYTNLAKAYWIKAERFKDFNPDGFLEYAELSMENLKLGLEREADPVKREETAKLMTHALGTLYVDGGEGQKMTYLQRYRDFTAQYPDLFSPHASFATPLYEQGSDLLGKKRQKDTYLDFFTYAGEAYAKAADIGERLGLADTLTTRLAGSCFLNAELFAQAATYLRKAVQLDPTWEESWLFLQFCYYQDKNYDGAIEAGRYLDEQIKTTNPDVFQILVRAYRDKAVAADEAGDEAAFQENKEQYEKYYTVYANYKEESDTTPPTLLRKAEREKAERLKTSIFDKDNIYVVEARIDGKFVRGKLINKTGSAISYIELNINLLNRDDEVIGSALGEVTALPPDRETPFTAAFMTEGVAGFRIKELFWE